MDSIKSYMRYLGKMSFLNLCYYPLVKGTDAYNAYEDISHIHFDAF